jgi:hypothetical protein
MSGLLSLLLLGVLQLGHSSTLNLRNENATIIFGTGGPELKRQGAGMIMTGNLSIG